MTRSNLFGTLVLGATLLARASYVEAAQIVTVNNTAGNPVPVTGGVAIKGTPTVRVGNGVADPVIVRSADDSLREVVQGSILVQIPGEQTRASDSLYVVPDGKRLVIEFLSAAKYAGPDGIFQVTTFAEDGAAVTHYIAPLQPGRTAAGEGVRLYSVNGLQAEADFFQPHDGASLRVSFSGYLEDVP